MAVVCQGAYSIFGIGVDRKHTLKVAFFSRKSHLRLNLRGTFMGKLFEQGTATSQYSWWLYGNYEKL
jgi:hypothetical protein